MTDIELIELIKKIIAELQKSKTGKTPQITPNGLGMSNPIKMKRANQRTQIAELKDRIRIKNLERELMKRDIASQPIRDQREYLRQFVTNFLNTRDVYEDNGYTVEEPDYEMYMQPPQPTTQGFSMSDNYGTFGETVGSDRFLEQRMPFQLQRGSFSQQPLEITSPSVSAQESPPEESSYMGQTTGSDIVEHPDAFIQDQPEAYGYSNIPDFGVGPNEQIDVANPYFDQTGEPPAQQQEQQQPEGIELPVISGRRPPMPLSQRLSLIRDTYRKYAGSQLDPIIYRPTTEKPLNDAIKQLALKQYISMGGSNPKVLKSKRLSLIESELQNLKDANSI